MKKLLFAVFLFATVQAQAARWILYTATQTVNCSGSLNGGKLTMTGSDVFCADDVGLSSTTLTTTYMTISSAAATYLSLNVATATYISLSSATLTYLQKSSSTANFVSLSSAAATYLQSWSALNASNLTSGTVPNARLDPSSVTLLGQAIDLSGTEATGVLAAGRFPALTGNVTTVAGALGTTIASVPNAALDASSVTLQANAFNGNSQLVKTNSTGGVSLAESTFTFINTMRVYNSTGVQVAGTVDAVVPPSWAVGYSTSCQVLLASAINSPGTGQYFDICSATIPAGHWNIIGTVSHINNGATTTYTAVAITQTAGNSTTGLVMGDNATEGPPSTAVYNHSIMLHWELKTAAPTVIYLKSHYGIGAGTPKSFGTLRIKRSD